MIPRRLSGMSVCMVRSARFPSAMIPRRSSGMSGSMVRSDHIIRTDASSPETV